MLGKIEGRRRRGRQDDMFGWHHRLNGHELSKLQEMVKDREAWRAAVQGSQQPPAQDPSLRV